MNSCVSNSPVLPFPLYILVRGHGVVLYSANFRPHFTTANTQYLFISWPRKHICCSVFLVADHSCYNVAL